MNKHKSEVDTQGEFTAKEIAQQPIVWKKTFETIESQKIEIENFLERFLGKDVDVVLTGAGSSAFIGNAVYGVRLKHQQKQSRVVPTTELITHPEYFLLPTMPTVLVSFARSGNSPESLAAVQVVDQFCMESYHIVITCDENGKLYTNTDPERTLKILLPPETNDISLAMTSSFSSMMLAFILLTKVDQLDKERTKINELSNWGNVILDRYEGLISDIASIDFERAVFLGSGPLRGTAEESHLKLQELTDGKVICAFNSFLGFRHGPRAIVNDKTLLVYLFSDDPLARKYEYDLVHQINQNGKGIAQVAISHKPVDIDGLTFDLIVCFGEVNEGNTEIEYLCVVEIMLAQLLGYHKSLNLNLNPDQPSVSGTISRVVEGVIIYNQKN
jgi:tagatose-6-phosphate ketose/aldose isomerase